MCEGRLQCRLSSRASFRSQRPLTRTFGMVAQWLPGRHVPLALLHNHQGEALDIRQLSHAAPTWRRFEYLTLIPNGAPLGLGHRFGYEPGATPRAISGRAVGAAVGAA